MLESMVAVAANSKSSAQEGRNLRLDVHSEQL